MDLMELQELPTGATLPIHPALDMIADTLYVTLRLYQAGRLESVVFSSTGELFGTAEWPAHCAAQGLVSLAPPGGHRLPLADLRELAEHLRKGDATAPSWREAYEAVYAALDAHLVLCDPRYLVVLALWTLMTYVHPLFEFLPILHLQGPAESGKSRAAAVLAALAFNGLLTGSPTPAALFREAHEGRYTQFLAEADHLAELDSGDTFVRQLQSSCAKAEASVALMEGSTAAKGTPFQVARYHSFVPRVLLSITV
ncbi:MAG TPA: hypothetical protein VFU63_08345, partial [Ktedonobacterales bacterium]|nr:hypothetical protein [Ktedonobacterales bacterium]